MYYENKRSFYIKQYGPATIIILISIVLIGTGIFMSIKSMNKGDNTTIVAEQPKTTEETAEKVMETNSYELTNKSKKGKVTDVNGIVITVESGDNTYDVNLIGIKEHAKYTKLSETIKNELLNKEVTLDFDQSETEDGQTYGYIYLKNNLYNELLLASGYAELRAERVNINKLNILLAAQLKARHDGLGIWKY